MSSCFVCGRTTTRTKPNPIIFCEDCLPDETNYTVPLDTDQGAPLHHRPPSQQIPVPRIPTPMMNSITTTPLDPVYTSQISMPMTLHIEVPLGSQPIAGASSSRHVSASIPEGLVIVKDKVASDTKLEASIKRRRRLRFEPSGRATEIVCDICGQTFTKRHNLTSHVNSHYGVKRFSCSLCGKYFSRKTDCQRHEREYCKQRPPSAPDL
jgi:uncharacterized Zn-finger protein